MKLHRFFVHRPLGKEDSLLIENKGLAHQMKNVLRMEAGDSAVLFDNTGFEYLCEIISIADEVIQVRVADRKRKELKTKNEIILCFSLIKKDNVEFILEKCTELGVKRFIPLMAERTEKKDLNMERAEKIIIEASEQSGRVILPDISPIARLEQVLVSLLNMGAVPVVFHPKGEKFNKESILSKAENNPVAIFIGPEGGWSDGELKFFNDRGISEYSLGEQILKAETAAIVATACIII